MSNLPKSPPNSLNVLELFAGIGGWHFALKEAEPTIEWNVVAVDISPNAAAVYHRNFPATRFVQRLVETFSPSQFACFPSHSTAASFSSQPAEQHSQPDLLLMSPPCQPFTRLGRRAGLDDTRCAALVSLIAQLSSGGLSPRALVLENVLGFECSSARQQLLAALTASRYRYAEAALNPLQFGVPNSRPRYYLLAVRTDEEPCRCFPVEVNSVDAEPPVPEFVNGGGTLQLEELKRLVSQPLECTTTLGAFLSSSLLDAPLDTIDAEATNGSQNTAVPEIGFDEDEEESLAAEPTAQHETESTSSSADCPPGLEGLPRDFRRHYMSLEVVHAGRTRSSCVTHGYGGSVRGSGPLLSPLVPLSCGSCDAAAVAECERLLDELEAARGARDVCRELNALAALRPRLLSTREISALLCFPTCFALDSKLKARQLYRLLGNSINVRVAAQLIRLLMPFL